MILLYVTVTGVLFGSSAGLRYAEVCYGRSYKLPYGYAPPLFHGPLYFTPSKGGSTRLLMDNGEAKDPRLKVSIVSAELTDLTEKDAGTFSISRDGERPHDVIKLEISDCAEEETRTYGERFSYSVPRLAEFLEFTPLNSEDQPKVLWNRTDPRTNTGGRGQVKRNVWQILNVNMADMGFYNFRKKDNTLLLRIQLTVEANYRSYHTEENKRLVIASSPGDEPWTVTFTSESGYHETLMKAGRVVEDADWDSKWPLTERMQVVRGGIDIYPVKSTDTGTFVFKDPQGHVTQNVDVVVNIDQASTFVYVGIAVGVLFAMIVCCCCVKKCCCKKTSSKRAESAPQTAATPAVYYHDSNQSGGQIYSAAPAPGYSHQPLNSLVSREPASASPEPSVYNPVNVHVSSPLLEVDPLGRQGDNPAPSLGSDCLSSDPEPRFELKLPSALPLSSDSTFSDVYTSDKLNFL